MAKRGGLDINIGSKKSRLAWVRDFNHREFEEKESINKVSMKYYFGKVGPLKSALQTDIAKEMKLVNDKGFHIISNPNVQIQDFASGANLLPSSHILIPNNPGEIYPAYTPIALAGNSGNKFGIIAYLPPDDSRTKIKIDGVKKRKQLWAAKVISAINAKLLPSAIKHITSTEHKDSNKILHLLPRISTDRSFTDGNLMSIPNLMGGDDSEDYLLNKEIRDSWAEIRSSWREFTEYVSNQKIFKSVTGGYISAKEVIKINLFDDKKLYTLTKIFEKLGKTVLQQQQEFLLEELNKDDWGQNHPFEQMNSITTLNDLRLKLESMSESLSINTLGEDLVKEFIDIIHKNPPDEWKDDIANRKLIPCVPNADGDLLPLVNEFNENNFYADSQEFPDLILSSRRIHTNFASFTDYFDLQNPEPEELSKLIDEGVKKNPDVYNDLAKHTKLHKQISLALTKMAEGTFPTQTMRNQKFIPVLRNGKICVRGLSRFGNQHVWPLDGIGSATRTSFHGREMIFGDSPKDRNKVKLHKLIFERLHWLELHPDLEDSRSLITEKLHANKAISSGGINLIRSLIFAWPIPNTSHIDKSLFYKYEDNTWEVDKWIEKEISNKQRDEILESLLQLIRLASDGNKHGGMSTGWGADSRERVHSLHLLKDESGEWSTLGDLCYDLRADLTELFEKKAVCEKHREILGHKVLTYPIGKSGGAGLGIMHRIGELEVKDKLRTLDAYSPQLKSKILGMMLESEEEWELSSDIGLSEVNWIPSQSDKLLKFEDCILPTKATTKIIGSNHPWNLITDVDTSSENVKSRSKELGIKSNIDDAILLHQLLIEPEELWNDLKGKLILQKLTNYFLENPDTILSKNRKSRLPDKDGNWHENSWLVEEVIFKQVKSVFPSKNIVTAAIIGGNDVAEMSKNWLLNTPHGPGPVDLLQKLSSFSEIPKSEINKKQLQQLWEIIYYYHNNSSFFNLSTELKNYDCSDFLFLEKNNILSLEEIIIQSEHFGDWNAQDLGLVLFDSNHKFSDLLRDYFEVFDLDDVGVKELKIVVESVKQSNFSDLSISRYWIILAACKHRYHSLLHESVWLYKHKEGYSFTELKNTYISRKALIPTRNDSIEVINNMINQKCSLFWLPRNGHLQEMIYDSLESISDIPFLDLMAKPKTVGLKADISKEDWPYLSSAMQNVLDALNLTDNIALLSINKVKVYKTKEPISSDLYAQTASGTPEVFWKKSSKRESILIDIDTVAGIVVILVSTSGVKLEDDSIITKLEKRLLKNTQKSRELLARLVRYDESRWSDFDSLIGEREWLIHSRPLIEKAVYSDLSPKLAAWYGGCQVCGRQTPSDRSGGFQEGVVSLFKESGGRYYSDSIQYTTGNVMYLCPVHKSLYSRSKNSKLLWIPVVEEASKQIEATPTKDKVKEIVNKILSTTGDIEIEVMTFEKIKGDGQEKPTEKIHQVKWVKEHASSFRDAVTQYLTGLIN